MTPERIIEAGLNSPNITTQEKYQLQDMQVFVNGYAEPGYQTDKPYIILGNYNPSDFNNSGDFGRVCDALERVAELEWEDEWMACDDCGKLFRTIGDSYHWQAFYNVGCTNGCFLCGNCVDPEDYLNEIMDNPNVAITLDIDPLHYGFHSYNGRFESGFHVGQTDDPRKIAEKVKASGFSHYVFKIDRVSQFDIHFKVYVK